MEFTYAVIGGGIAGVSCAEIISILHPEASCVILSASPVVKAVTNITPVSKMATEFSVEEKSLEDAAAIYSAKIISDVAVEINPLAKTIYTENGRLIRYEKLCVCSGATPRVIDEGNPYVLGIRDTDSVEKLCEKLKTSRRVLIVGNGGIATDLAYQMRGVQKIWAIKDNHISATFIDPGAAHFFTTLDQKKESKPETPKIAKRLRYSISPETSVGSCKGAALGPDWHGKFGLTSGSDFKTDLTIEYNAEVLSVITNNSRANEKSLNSDWSTIAASGRSLDSNWPVTVNLTNGKSYGCDFIVSATGVVPNSKSIRILGDNEFELDADEGILVNWKMETNLENIYAAGDVCAAGWELAAQWFQMRLWTQARHMGCYAARCMVSSIRNETVLQDFCFEMFAHVTRFFGFKVVLLGLFNGQRLNNNYEVMLRTTKGEEYVKLVMRDGKLQGAVLIGETDLEEMCENLILDQLDLTMYGEQLLDPNIDIEDYFD